MATITSAGTGNSDATATWVGGVVPDADDDVVIDSGHTVTQNANATFNSLAVNGTFVASSSYSLTIDGERSNGRALDIVGTFTHGNGTITITTAADTDLRWPSSSEAYNITINNASCIARPTGDKPVIANNLTITAGEYNTLDSGGSTSHALTVAGVVTNNGTLTLNGSTVNLGSTSAEAGDFQGSGTFNLDTSTINFHTAGSANFTPSTSANFDTNTSTLNLIGLNSSNRAHNFTFASGNLHNITTSRGAGTDTHTDTLNGNTTITGNLTVGANSIFDTGSDRDLTVTGTCTLNGGTFTGNASTVSHGVLTISSGTYNASSGTTTLNGTADVGMRVDGTFNNNDGTFVIDGSITKVQMGSIGGAPTGFSINNAPFHHLTINDSINFAWADKTLFNVEGDLIVAAGQTLGANNTNGGIKVLGNVTLNGQLGNSNLTNDCEFGSLTINSGGTYNATSGTTTITKDSGAGSSSNRAAFCHASGTFTHNNGLFKTTQGNADVEFTSQSETNNPFYDFEATQYAIAATSPWVVLNNMTIANGFQFNGSSGFAKVLGIMKQTGGTYNASDVSSSTSHFFNHYKLEGGTLDLSNIDITVGSIRNTGGTIS